MFSDSLKQLVPGAQRGDGNMELQVRVDKKLTISEEEFEKACMYVRGNTRQLVNSFLGTHHEPTVEEYIRALHYYLFTGESDV